MLSRPEVDVLNALNTFGPDSKRSMDCLFKRLVEVRGHEMQKPILDSCLYALVRRGHLKMDNDLYYLTETGKKFLKESN